GKWLVATYPVGEFLAIRSGATLILLTPFIWKAGRSIFTGAPRPGLQLLRLVLGTTEVALFFWAVAYLPLADAITRGDFARRDAAEVTIINHTAAESFARCRSVIFALRSGRRAHSPPRLALYITPRASPGPSS